MGIREGMRMIRRGLSSPPTLELPTFFGSWSQHGNGPDKNSVYDRGYSDGPYEVKWDNTYPGMNTAASFFVNDTIVHDGQHIFVEDGGKRVEKINLEDGSVVDGTDHPDRLGNGVQSGYSKSIGMGKGKVLCIEETSESGVNPSTYETLVCYNKGDLSVEWTYPDLSYTAEEGYVQSFVIDGDWVYAAVDEVPDTGSSNSGMVRLSLEDGSTDWVTTAGSSYIYLNFPAVGNRQVYGVERFTSPDSAVIQSFLAEDGSRTPSQPAAGWQLTINDDAFPVGYHDGGIFLTSYANNVGATDHVLTVYRVNTDQGTVSDQLVLDATDFPNSSYSDPTISTSHRNGAGAIMDGYLISSNSNGSIIIDTETFTLHSSIFDGISMGGGEHAVDTTGVKPAFTFTDSPSSFNNYALEMRNELDNTKLRTFDSSDTPLLNFSNWRGNMVAPAGDWVVFGMTNAGGGGGGSDELGMFAIGPQ